MDVIQQLNLCRVCLSPNNGEFLDIHSELIQDEETIDLVTVLRQIGGIPVKKDDRQPKFICPVCLDQALIARVFRENCQNSIKILEACIKPNVIVPVSDKFSIFYIDNKDKEKAKKVSCNPRRSYKKEKCKIEMKRNDISTYLEETSIKQEISLQSDETVKIPEDVVIVQNSETGECQFYRPVGETPSGEVHLATVDPNEAAIYSGLLSQPNNEDIFATNIFRCKICSTFSDVKEKIVRHLFEQHNLGPYECSHCGEKLASVEDSQNHISKHGNYVCDYCRKHFISKLALEGHINRHNETYSWNAKVCDLCGKTFNSEYKYQIHVRTVHSASKSWVYTCDVCGAGYTSKGRFTAHLDKHESGQITHDNKSFMCDICGAGYSSRYQIAAHIWGAHFDRRSHVCRVCGKGFRTLGTLKGHLVVHTRERRFQCHICQMGLVDKRALVQHVRVHTDSRPFRCDICGRGFVSSARVNSHKKTSHSRPTKKCPLCPGLFHLKSMLRSHIKKVHVENAHKSKRNRYTNTRVDWEVEELTLDDVQIPDNIKKCFEVPGTKENIKSEECSDGDYINAFLLRHENDVVNQEEVEHYTVYEE